MSAVSSLFYSVFALGGVGIYFLLPGARHHRPRTGALIGLLALGGWLTVPGARVVAGGASSIFFYLFATVAILAAVRVITHPKPVYSALYFVLVVIAVAAILVLQHAEFLAVALIIIYAGAIIVTYLFVIMLAHQSGSPVYDRRSREPFLSVAAAFALMATIAARAGEVSHSAQPGTEMVAAREAIRREFEPVHGNTFALGAAVLTTHVVVLELSGLLLLISMIGAIALSKKRVPSEVIASPRPQMGQAGREAKPF